MREEFLRFARLPAVLYGGEAPGVWLCLHGKNGCKEESAAFAEVVCPKGWQVLAVDLPEHGARRAESGFDPWHAVPELRALLSAIRRRWDRAALRAVSLGAYFSLLAFRGERLDKALFVSPVVDMEALILEMMGWAGVREEELRRAGELPTDFGETLSWRYLQYARAHPPAGWETPTEILYAGGDHLVRREAVEDFARRFACGLTVMEAGEHWFHTPEQLAVLRAWEASRT